MRRALAASPRFRSSVRVRAKTVSFGKYHILPEMICRAFVVAIKPSPGMARWCWATAPSFHIGAMGDHDSTPLAGVSGVIEVKRPVSLSLRGKARFAGGAVFAAKRCKPPL